jgi:SAM-dependent methyltransferase
VTATTGRLMLSDQTVVPGRLGKVACDVCGLVRTAAGAFDVDLDTYYTDAYDVTETDHLFYAPDGPMTRSRVLAEWMAAEVDPARWRGRPVIAEVGSGSGHLLVELARRYPDAVFHAVEPGTRAAEKTRVRGFVAVRDIDQLPSTSCDVVVAVAVIEHVASPTSFLRTVRERLRTDGILVLAQPTQDVTSYDVLMADHLHHFSSSHLTAYGRKCGFREITRAIGHPLIPHFSLHVWEAATPVPGTWSGPPAATRSLASVAQVMGDMARLNTVLSECVRDHRRVSVFGIREVFAIARAYSALGLHPIVCGLDDDPRGRGDLWFPVVRPEEAGAFHVSDAILTMNAVHYPVATNRLKPFGVRVHPVLSPCA